MQVMLSLDRLNDYISSWGVSAFSTLIFLVLFIAIELYVNEFEKKNTLKAYFSVPYNFAK